MFINQFEFLYKANTFYIRNKLDELQERRQELKYQSYGRVEFDTATGGVYQVRRSLDNIAIDLLSVDNQEQRLKQLLNRAEELNEQKLKEYTNEERTHLIECMQSQATDEVIIHDLLFQNYTNEIYKTLIEDRNERNSNLEEKYPPAKKRTDYTCGGLYEVPFENLIYRDRVPVSKFVQGNKKIKQTFGGNRLC